MHKDIEKKQWIICGFCGSKRIHGDSARKAFDLMISSGVSLEKANEYVSSNMYLDCPTPEKHSNIILPYDQLEHGQYYHGHCRNARVARWNSETQKFVYMREKFGFVFPEEIGYWIEAKQGEFRFDEFKPFGKMENLPFEIPLTDGRELTN